MALGSKRYRMLISSAMIIALLGFTTAYISLSKTMIPRIIQVTVSEANYLQLPYWLQDNERSKIIWATIFSFGILLPMACFRKLSMLRFTSVFGVVCTTTIMLVLLYEFLFNDKVVP